MAIHSSKPFPSSAGGCGASSTVRCPDLVLQSSTLMWASREILTLGSLPALAHRFSNPTNSSASTKFFLGRNCRRAIFQMLLALVVCVALRFRLYPLGIGGGWPQGFDVRTPYTPQLRSESLPPAYDPKGSIYSLLKALVSKPYLVQIELGTRVLN